MFQILNQGSNNRNEFIFHSVTYLSNKPSEADIRITKTVKNALKLVDIELLDHLILTYEEKYATIETDGLGSG